jgi:hypothetical protein
MLAAASEERGVRCEVCAVTTALVSSLRRLPLTRERARSVLLLLLLLLTHRERVGLLVMCGSTTAVLSDRRALETFWERYNAPILFAPHSQRTMGSSLDTTPTFIMLSSQRDRTLLNE